MPWLTWLIVIAAALIVAWAIRHLITSAGRERVMAHWTGDPETLERILRLARVAPATSS